MIYVHGVRHLVACTDANEFVQRHAEDATVELEQAREGLEIR